MNRCNNCKQQLIENSNYCHLCGQNTRNYNDSFWSIAKSQMHELLDIDGRLSRTLKVLITQPGELSKAYKSGQRVLYTPPLRLYIAISILFFLLIAYLGPVYSPNTSEFDKTADYYARSMFVLFPIFALLIGMFFKQSRFIYNLVFSMHIHTLVYLVLMVITPLEANEVRHTAFVWLQIPPSLYLGWHYLVAFHRVYEQPWTKTVIKSVVIFMIYISILGIAFDVILTHIINTAI